MTAVQLLPNLGAEEGLDWEAIRREPSVRLAAQLWSHLFSSGVRLRIPAQSPGEDRESIPCDARWPAAFGPRAPDAVFDWLEDGDRPIAWLRTPGVEREAREALGAALAGPSSDVVRALHDKAFAAHTARDLELVPDALAPLVEVIEPDELRSPDELVARLGEALRAWPEWTRRRFTLKPRHGSSGRGRVGGRDELDTPSIRGAFARLAGCGGAIFEPWLERDTDLSVVLRVPPPEEASSLPTLLGSLELLVTPSGVYRGHCGEIDSRGRVFSGHALDETLRTAAAAVAQRAHARGFSGPCGIDAFTYLEDDRERLRPLVEFNARSTMGLVALGLVRRALPRVRAALDLEPGTRRAFLLTMVPSGASHDVERLVRACGPDALMLDLAADADAPTGSAGPRPLLVFGGEKERLRRAHREVLGC